MKAKIKTLGCRANQYDSVSMMEQLSFFGITICDSNSADLIIVNTCTVTALAQRKSCQEVRKAIRLKDKNKKVIVTGCSVRTKDREITNIKGIDYALEDYDLSKVISDSNKGAAPNGGSPSRVSRVRSYLKIEEGCEDNCSYCIVPEVRGKVKSKPLKTITDEAKKLIKRGAKEIVLTGINIGCYSYRNYKLEDVIKELCSIKELKRLRLSSIEPQYFNKKLIKLVALEEKICPYFHIPMQSGSDKILKKMGRKYKAKDLKVLVNSIRRKRKNAFVSADIIVGFPGEKDNDFQKTLNLIKDLSLSKVHVFRYSPRPNTLAKNFPNQIDNCKKKSRAKLVNDLSLEQFKKYAIGHIGSTATVLIEQKKNNCFCGLTPNYLRIKMKDHGKDLIGSITGVKLRKFKGEYFEGD